MSALTQFLTAYALTSAALVLIDLLWLGILARPRREKGLARLLETVRRHASRGLLLHALFALGLLSLALVPHG